MNTLTTPPPQRPTLLGRSRTRLLRGVGGSGVRALVAVAAPRTTSTLLAPPQERTAPLLEAAPERRQAADGLQQLRETGARVAGYGSASLQPGQSRVARTAICASRPGPPSLGCSNQAQGSCCSCRDRISSFRARPCRLAPRVGRRGARR